MSANAKDSKSTWIDPDEAPEWSAEMFERAEVREGDKVLRPAAGTLTKRGRPHLNASKGLSEIK